MQYLHKTPGQGKKTFVKYVMYMHGSKHQDITNNDGHQIVVHNDFKTQITD